MSIVEMKDIGMTVKLTHVTDEEFQPAYKAFLLACFDKFEIGDLKKEPSSKERTAAYIDFFSTLYQAKLDAVKPGYFKELEAILGKTDAKKEELIHYLGWLCERALDGKLRREDYFKAYKYINIYQSKYNDFSNEGWVELSNIRDLPHLYKVIEGSIEDEISSKQIVAAKRAALISNGNIHVVYESADLQAYIPLTTEASQNLGVGTQWCISANNDCAFEEYNGEGNILILFPKNQQPLALHFASQSFCDYTDAPIKLSEILKQFPIVARMKPWFPNHDGIDHAPAFAEAEDAGAVASQTIEKNYLAIKNYPEARPDLQLAALKKAKLVLDRTKKIAPAYLNDTHAAAIKAFSMLVNPTKEVTSWLDEARPDRPKSHLQTPDSPVPPS